MKSEGTIGFILLLTHFGSYKESVTRNSGMKLIYGKLGETSPQQELFRLWNCLPRGVKEIPLLVIFKNKTGQNTGKCTESRVLQWQGNGLDYLKDLFNL